MSDIRVEFEGYEQFAARLRQAPEIVRDEMGRGVENVAMAGSGYAKRIAPFKTGHYRRSITHTTANFAGGSVTAAFGSNAPYARVVEAGSEPHVITAKRAKALRFTIGKKVLFRRRVNHPGTTGRWVFKRAKEWLEPQVRSEFRAVVQRIMNRVGG
jgi:hypothetical protein